MSIYYREQSLPEAINKQVGYHQKGLAMALFDKCGGRLDYGLHLLRIEYANISRTMREIAALGERSPVVEARHQEIKVKPVNGKAANDNQAEFEWDDVLNKTA